MPMITLVNKNNPDEVIGEIDVDTAVLERLQEISVATGRTVDDIFNEVIREKIINKIPKEEEPDSDIS